MLEINNWVDIDYNYGAEFINSANKEPWGRYKNLRFYLV